MIDIYLYYTEKNQYTIFIHRHNHPETLHTEQTYIIYIHTYINMSPIQPPTLHILVQNSFTNSPSQKRWRQNSKINTLTNTTNTTFLTNHKVNYFPNYFIFLFNDVDVLKVVVFF